MSNTAFMYVHCDVPASMTLDDWREARNRARRDVRLCARRQRRAAVVANLRRCIPACAPDGPRN